MIAFTLAMRLDNFDSAGASALLAEMARDARALVEPGARGAPVTERRLAYMVLLALQFLARFIQALYGLPLEDHRIKAAPVE